MRKWTFTWGMMRLASAAPRLRVSDLTLMVAPTLMVALMLDLSHHAVTATGVRQRFTTLDRRQSAVQAANS
jgi:hypothetical protein